MLTAIPQSALIENHSQQESWLVQAREGDEEAFRRLLGCYSDQVYAIAFAMLGNREEARDVAQDVFMRFVVHLDKIKIKRGLGGWFRKVTVNRCCDQLKQRAKYQTLAGPESLQVEPAFDSHLRLNRYLAVLTPRERAAITLVYHQGLSCKDAAAAMGCMTGTVKALCHRARGKIRKQEEKGRKS